MLVKICGLRTVEHALAATAAGAAMLGLVFAPSRRQVTPEQAAAIVAAVVATPHPAPHRVGLFVNTAPALINTLAAQVGLDYVQLSGDEPVAYAELLTLPIIKAIRMDGSAHEAAWIRLACAEQQSGGQRAVILLVDAHVPGRYGGTGVVADWGRAAELAARAPTMLAGGLTPANVAAAIAAVRPLGVDVSSGVEQNGQQDPAKIKAFVGAARAAQG